MLPVRLQTSIGTTILQVSDLIRLTEQVHIMLTTFDLNLMIHILRNLKKLMNVKLFIRLRQSMHDWENRFML